MPFALSGADRKKKSGVFRSTKEYKDKKQSKFSNVFKNAVAPFASGKAFKGSAVYVALEVIVAKILRRILKVGDKTFAELAIVHALSLPLLGGVTAAFNQADRGTIPYGAKKVGNHIKEGAKSVPALFLAQYTYDSYCHGIGLRFWAARDALVMAVAKILTRPIASKLYKKSKFMQNAFDSVQLMQESQQIVSNLSRSTGAKSSRFDDE